MKIRPGISSLRTMRMVREVERSFARGCSRPGFRLVHYSLQRNHVHLIVEATSRGALGRGMMAIAGRLGRAINRVCHRTGKVFADRYHLHVLKTPREVRSALRYVLLNARRHARRVTDRERNAQLDPASSAQWFEGWRPKTRRWMVIDAPGSARASPVAPARTWLLKTGWRRHGLLDPAEVPG